MAWNAWRTESRICRRTRVLKLALSLLQNGAGLEKFNKYSASLVIMYFVFDLNKVLNKFVEQILRPEVYLQVIWWEFRFNLC